MFEKADEFKADEKNSEQLEISEEVFVEKAGEIKEELNGYVKAVENFQKSDDAIEISKNAIEITRILSFARLPSFSESLEKNIKYYKENNLEYDEEKIQEIVLRSCNQQTENR